MLAPPQGHFLKYKNLLVVFMTVPGLYLRMVEEFEEGTGLTGYWSGSIRKQCSRRSGPWLFD